MESTKVTIVVGGREFSLPTDMLQKLPDSKLFKLYKLELNKSEKLVVSELTKPEKPIISEKLIVSEVTKSEMNKQIDLKLGNSGKIKPIVLRFERNPKLFEFVLDFYRLPTSVHIPRDVCTGSLLDEMKFWNLSESRVSGCCWRTLKREKEAETRINELESLLVVDYPGIKAKWTHFGPTRRRMAAMWMHLRYPGYSCFGKVYTSFIMIINSLSILSLLFSGTELLRHKTPNQPKPKDDEKFSAKYRYFFLETKISEPFAYIDASLNSILTLDIFLRFVLAPFKAEFFKNLLNWVDIVAILPYWSFLFPLYLNWNGIHDVDQVVNAFVLAFSSFRVFKLFRLSELFVNLKILILLFRKSVCVLCTLLAFFGIFTIMFSIFIFQAELSHDDTIPDVASACWYSIVTLTSVGYGDQVPKSKIGYLVGALCGVTGLILTGMVVPILGENFSFYYSHAMSINNKKESERSRDCAENAEAHDRLLSADSETETFKLGDLEESRAGDNLIGASNGVYIKKH